MNWIASMVAQCPCSGGGSGSGGGNGPLIWVALAGVLGLWLMVGWTRRTWNRKSASTAGRMAKVGAIVAITAGICLAVAADFTRRENRPVASAPCVLPAGKLPQMLDLGSKSCIPCKMMAPILEDLTKEYAGRLDVEFIDVWVKENAAKAKEFGIKLIPTQIFFDASGKELWRHEGYISKEDILAKWRELGYEFSKATVPRPDTQGASRPAAN